MAEPLSLAEVLTQGLSSHVQTRLQRHELEAASARAQQAAGQYDWTLSTEARQARTVTPASPSATPDQTTRSSSSYRVGAERLLGQGVRLETGLETSGVLDQPAELPQRQHQTRLTLQFVVPVLRGSRLARAEDEAARLAWDTQRWRVRATASEAVLGLTQRYWEYRAECALLGIATRSLQRSRDLLASNETLVKADEKPAGDLVLLRADLTDKANALEAAQLRVREARRRLGRSMGLDARASDRLPVAEDPFPVPSESIGTLLSQAETLKQRALAARPDLRADALQQQSQRALLDAARDAERPQLDLKLGLSYGQASEGSRLLGLPPLSGRSATGPSWFATLNYQFAVENRRAGGRLRELIASLEQLQLRAADNRESALSEVESALQTLWRNGQQIRTASEGLSLYEKAVAQEVVKLRSGIATLMDVINLETRYVNAQVGITQLQLSHATALARLRHETGTLFEPPSSDQDADTLGSLDVRALSTLDSLDSLQRSGDPVGRKLP
ncbi:TolC family protein [Mitsuaria sp. WAJ17]|uniref:TolC family protein n=1 Tax=Mitsuaria sp. WAJ17 TaxID=2761452 RepID=UPI00160360B3|nr:TolC family protein [Mitsuaria sp. WAJ17]MBB2484691.1 TolC family protein [Mitsuaria sp. WAJ17]